MLFQPTYLLKNILIHHNILDDISHPTILGDLKRIHKEFNTYRTFGFGEYRESEKLSNGLHSYIISKFIELFKIKNQKLIRAKQNLAYSKLLNEKLGVEHDPQDKNVFQNISQNLEKINLDPTILTRIMNQIKKEDKEKQDKYHSSIQSLEPEPEPEPESDISILENQQNEQIDFDCFSCLICLKKAVFLAVKVQSKYS